MKKVKVGCAQTRIQQFDLPKIHQTMLEFVKRAKEDHGVNLLLFPELSAPGYIIPRDREFGVRYYNASEEVTGPTTNFLCETAEKYKINIISGISRRHPTIPGVLYNSSVLVSPEGKIVGMQDKIHIPGYEKNYFEAGNQIRTFPTEMGRVGIVICYDNQFPEYARLLSLEGCTIICMLWMMLDYGGHPNDFLSHVTSTRAAENRCYAVSCNAVGPIWGTNNTYVGGSCVSNPLGKIISSGSSTEEQLLVSELDMDFLIQERIFQPVFNDRRPELYKDLLNKSIRPTEG